VPLAGSTFPAVVRLSPQAHVAVCESRVPSVSLKVALALTSTLIGTGLARRLTRPRLGGALCWKIANGASAVSRP
jgi:hypothetical protein